MTLATNLTPEILSYLGSGSSEPLLEEDVVLILRNSHAGGSSYGGFQWPEEGAVEAKDWDPAPKCGYGLHGFLWGEGDGGLAKWEPDAVWQVVAVSSHDIVDLDGKVKFPRGWVLYSGTQEEATRRIAECAPLDAVIIGRIASVGDGESITVGYGGAATTGDYGYAFSGHKGHAVAGHYGHAIVGDFGTAIAGHYGYAKSEFEGRSQAGSQGYAISGNEGRSTVGNYGTAISGTSGNSVVGDYGHAIVSYYGHAKSGVGGHAKAGEKGRAQAGEGGVISIDWYDSSSNRMRTKVGYVGEDDIKPDVWYRVDEEGNFVEVK